MNKASKLSANRLLKSLIGLKYKKEIARNWNKSEKEIKIFQVKKLNEIYKHAIKNIEYYKSRKESYPFIEFNDNSLEVDLKQLPILEKKEVKDHNRDFFNKSLTQKNHFTSGSSGKPLELSANLMEKGYQQALFDKIHKEIGTNKPIRVFLTLALKREDSLYEFDLMRKNLYISIFKLNEKNRSEIINLFRKNNIRSMYAFPSALYQLTRLLDGNFKFNKTMPVIVTSEVMKKEWKPKIEKELNVEIHNFYSSQESAHATLECTKGYMHINPFFGLVELLDDKGNEVKEHQAGNIVVTGLIRKSFPLIRYKIGDVATKVNSNFLCECGNEWKVIGEVVGRDDDLIKTKNGETFRLSLFKGIKNTEEGQLIQLSYSEFQINVVPKKMVSKEEIEEELISKLASYLGESSKELNVSVNYFESIPREKNGKFRSVYSRI